MNIESIDPRGIVGRAGRPSSLQLSLDELITEPSSIGPEGGRLHTVEELAERLSRPCPELVEDVGKISGDIVVIGAAGKLGTSLVRVATCAVADAGSTNRVFAVSRFSSLGRRTRSMPQAPR